MPQVTINSQLTEALANETLFDCAERVGVRVPTSCQRQGKCRECLVEVVEGMEHLTPPTAEEKHLKDKFRLSCRTRLRENAGSIRCHTLRRSAIRVEKDYKRISSHAPVAPGDPAVKRDGDRVLLEGEEIARGDGRLLGLAVDLGTTTVVMRLVDLETGNHVATESFENPQRFAGSDIMARIRFDTDHKGRLLQRTLVGYMNHAIENFPCKTDEIYEAVVCGNTTMRDIFFGLNVHSVGQKPYRSLVEQEFRDGKRVTTALSVEAKKLGLVIHPRGRVVSLPLIASHLGADAAACLLAIGLAQEERVVAMMDIGTNTELVVGNRHRVMAASCPAGPAFEGGSISCGMPGLDGAIERVKLNGNGAVHHQVIGGGKPDGICGSGLIDLLSELLRVEKMNSLGRLEDGSDRFVVDPANQVFIEENDVSQLAQAKGANVAGLSIVFKNYGIQADDLACFYLAGGFARHIDINAARRIGLIPNLPDEKIIQIGNASLAGAEMALLSVGKRQELEKLVKTIRHVELETDPDFFNYFVEGCQFQPMEGRVSA